MIELGIFITFCVTVIVLFTISKISDVRMAKYGASTKTAKDIGNQYLWKTITYTPQSKNKG